MIFYSILSPKLYSCRVQEDMKEKKKSSELRGGKRKAEIENTEYLDKQKPVIRGHP